MRRVIGRRGRRRAQPQGQLQFLDPCLALRQGLPYRLAPDRWHAITAAAIPPFAANLSRVDLQRVGINGSAIVGFPVHKRQDGCGYRLRQHSDTS